MTLKGFYISHRAHRGRRVYFMAVKLDLDSPCTKLLPSVW
jgi:hypothetical protein